MSSSSPSLGARIRELRLARGLSMRALAQASGLKSVAFVADVEKGFRNPSREVLDSLARTLEQSVETLRRLDHRAPVQELRELAQKNPDWATALRKFVDVAEKGGLSPEQFVRLLDRRNELPSMPRSSKRNQTLPDPGPGLFEA